MHNKSDKLDHLIALAAMKCAEEEAQEFKALDTSNVEFDSSYYKKRKQIINKCKRRPAARLTKMVAIRVAAALIIMITLGCVLIGCVPEWREAIFNAIVEWYDDCFAVRYENPEGNEKETGHTEESISESETEEIISVPTYIETIRKPTYLPEGVWEDILASTQTTINIDYYFNEEYLFSFSQILLKPNDNYVDNEEVDVRYTKISGNDATVVRYLNQDEVILFWCDGEYSYYIVSTECDIDTLIRYAESVK